MANTLTAARKAVSDAQTRLTELGQIKSDAQKQLETLETGELDIVALSSAQAELTTAERLVAGAKTRLSSAQTALSRAENETEREQARKTALEAVHASEKALVELHSVLAKGSEYLETLADKALEHCDSVWAAQQRFRDVLADHPDLADELNAKSIAPAKTPDQSKFGHTLITVASHANRIWGVVVERLQARQERHKQEQAQQRQERLRKRQRAQQETLEITVPTAWASRAERVFGSAVIESALKHYRDGDRTTLYLRLEPGSDPKALLSRQQIPWFPAEERGI